MSEHGMMSFEVCRHCRRLGWYKPADEPSQWRGRLACGRLADRWGWVRVGGLGAQEPAAYDASQLGTWMVEGCERYRTLDRLREL